MNQKGLKMHEKRQKNGVFGPKKTCFLAEFSLAEWGGTPVFFDGFPIYNCEIELRASMTLFLSSFLEKMLPLMISSVLDESQLGMTSNGKLKVAPNVAVLMILGSIHYACQKVSEGQ